MAESVRDSVAEVARADRELLALANDKGKFGIELGLVLEPPLQEAFERGIDHDWFRLVDVGPAACAPGRILRVFKLTLAGYQHRAEVFEQERRRRERLKDERNRLIHEFGAGPFADGRTRDRIAEIDAELAR